MSFTFTIVRSGLFSVRGWRHSDFTTIRTAIEERVRRDLLLAGAWVVGAFDPTHVSRIATGPRPCIGTPTPPDVVYFCSYSARGRPFSAYAFSAARSRLIRWIHDAPIRNAPTCEGPTGTAPSGKAGSKNERRHGFR
jgi:hypothetical protein